MCSSDLAALVDGNGRYLIEDDWRFTYLNSGRELVSPATAAAAGTAVFAAPDFGGAGLWSALPGARGEADDVRAALSGNPALSPISMRTGADASEAALKSLASPRVLHLATHGFYLKNVARAPVEASVSLSALPGASVLLTLTASDDPFLRSGIVLAGANRTDQTVGRRAAGTGSGTTDDGYVTAAEIALLNLTGCDLVTLSACESGLGDLRNGDGVQGLRRAFRLAGARSLVVSLFSVPDQETRTLMGAFYQGLASGKSKADALHDASRATFQRRKAAGQSTHPFFWAGFVLVGAP